MKIPLLILYLTVVYGICQTYGEKNFDLTEKIENEDYKLDMPLERFLSRHRRASLLSPITAPINMTLHLAGFTGIIPTVANFTRNILQDCPKEGLSHTVINLTLSSNPIEMIKIVLCFILHAIAAQDRVMFDLGMQFFRNFLYKFLPGLHMMLNKLDNTGILPIQISSIIRLFNIVYDILQVHFLPK